MVFSNFFTKQDNTTALPTEFGVTGLKHRNGALNEEFLPELRGTQGRKIYAEMTQAFVFGFALFEKVWQRNSDGTIALKKLAPRAAG
jgi:hypothetical protein